MKEKLVTWPRHNVSIVSSVALFAYLLQFGFTRASFVIPGMPQDSYRMKGDVNIGGLFRVHKYSAYSVCSSSVRDSKSFQYHEAMVFAINKVNNMADVLTNISLGYTILDDCTKDQTALARAMHFIPPAACCNCTLSEGAKYYDVIGVISGSNSQNTIAAAELLNLFKIPMVGAVATSEKLSDKRKYKYFIRVVPPDAFQAQAIVDILLRYNWTYISTINSEGSYGEMGAKAVRKITAANGICIAYSAEVSQSDETDRRYDEIAKGLMRHPNARVVIMFTQGAHARGVVAALEGAGAARNFVFIMSDGVSPGSDLVGYDNISAGSFFVQLYATGQSGFDQYFQALSPLTSRNPWLSELWELVFTCSWSYNISSNVINHCKKYKNVGEIPGYKPYNKTGLFLDTVLTFAYAIDSLVQSDCPKARQDKNLLKSCLQGPILLEHLYNVTFEGSYGTVTFDSKGDAEGKYQIDQLRLVDGQLKVETIGLWDKHTKSLTIDSDVFWNTNEYQGLESKMVYPAQRPESICSNPCNPGEFYIQQELKCCWECRRCRDNEIVVANRTSCRECSLFSWPNQKNFSSCEDIPAITLTWTDPVSLLSLVFSVCGLLACLIIFIVFVKHKDKRLVKATSWELSLLTLSGLVLAYIGAIFVTDVPQTVSCYAGRLCFNLSFCLAYAPLLAKTSRIYRIFAAAKHGTKTPPFINSKSQMILSLILIFVQVVISAVTVIFWPPLVIRRMPVRIEKYVEKLCQLPLEGLFPPLGFNLLLTLLCSLYGFKARSLPDNFNESRYIFLSVCTTLFLWIAFLPTYWAAFYAYQNALLLALALIMNSTVMLLCLYIPRAYAIYCVNEDKMQLTISVKGFGQAKHAASAGNGNNQVAPRPENSI